MRALIYGAALAGLLLPTWGMADSKPLLADMFQDHAVLQRDKPVTLWGQAGAGETVTLSLDGETTNAITGTDGRWQTTLPARSAGGPFRLEVQTSAGATQVVNDVLVGDVFLCSGQSNMEWPVNRSYGADSLASESTNDTIRYLNVEKHDSLKPLVQFNTPVHWQKAAPDTVPHWSAVCYTFARDLQTTTKVPIGLINASWGGSNIRPWISEQGLRAVPGHEESLDLLKLYGEDEAAAYGQFGNDFARWWAASGGEGAPWGALPKDVNKWPKVPDVTQYFENWGIDELKTYNGPLWYARSVKLSAAQAQGDATLTLGPIDDIDQTWVNGVGVGYTAGPSTPRVYKIQAGTLKAGDNVITINVLDLWSYGGLFSETPRHITFADGSSVALDDGWHYHSVPHDQRNPPSAPWGNISGQTTLYNGMIAPIGAYGLKGALWYQGESNAGEPFTYEALLTALFKDWRGQFGDDLPFLVVQLADFGPRPTKPVDSWWAHIREAQRQAVNKDGNAALAVTLDIGDPNDIHPLDKTSVGKRLSRAAQSLIYKATHTRSGPVPVSVMRTAGTVVIRFGQIDGTLVSYSTAFPISFELCEEDRSTCQYAPATLAGDQVRLTGPAVGTAKYVRYCWADSPTCTLYDNALPVGPFEEAIRP